MIIGIIIGSLIALSLIWCLVRCLCCGLSCCCGVCSCCNACCPSPRSRKTQNEGYQQAPPTPYNGYGGQYQPPPPMFAPGHNAGYPGGGLRGGAGSVANTATFDSPSQKYNEDALPPMPSWDNATSRRVEHDEPGDVEMEKLQPTYTQQEVGLLSHDQDSRYDYSNRQEAGDLGAGGMYASPYHDYSGHQQAFQSSPYGTQRGTASPNPYGSQRGTPSPNPYAQGAYTPQASQYSAPYRSAASPVAAPPYRSSPDNYGGQQSQRTYSPSVAAPSYHTQDVVSPVSTGQYQQGYQAFGRKPVQGSWREV